MTPMLLNIFFHRYGVWTIKAKYKKDFSTTGAANFEIKEYGKFSRIILLSLKRGVLQYLGVLEGMRADRQ